MKVKFIFAWYDLWVGAFWDQNKRKLYILPVPCFGLVIEFAPIPEKRSRLFSGYASLADMHDKNAIVRPPHIRGMDSDNCPGCLWVKNHVANSTKRDR